jgi:hypothetical protein
MAKHVILEQYTFTPSTNTIVVTGKNIRREQLLLITNVTAGTVIYNFSDPSLGFASYTNAVASGTALETTTIVLNYSTAAMTSTDKLAILTEETYQEMIPGETYRDPVDKLRVSEGQALIDTDFEYGTQPTKWEQINLVNNRPSAFYDFTQPITNVSSSPIFTGVGNVASSGAYQITAVTASSKVVTVAINNTTGITVGTPIFIQGTLDAANADGWWIVETVSSNTNFTFTAINTPLTALFDANKTYVYIGYFYTGAVIPATTTALGYSGTTVTAQTIYPHGLRVGDGVYITGTTGPATSINSSYVVTTTPNAQAFTFTVGTTPSTTITATANASIYTRALGYVEHRAYYGGVQFTNLSASHGNQVIRQTRRQFRYQSGKAMQFSTGSVMKPQLVVDTITSSGTTVTVTTKLAHGVQTGTVITVSGANETAYNGTFTVTGYTPTTLTYTAGSTPSLSPATGFPLTVSPTSWYGSSNRVGMFDNQNGFYFEYDGQTIYAVKRSSVKAISGVIAVSAAGSQVTGTSTKFTSQLLPGDYVVIRGMSYLVQNIQSDTVMTIYPEYRGTNSIINATVTKTINTRYAQSTWNIDKMDGTGASLFTLDLTKMQMFYMDFTWYGAGGIRFGFKNNRGEVIYCHRIPNNNVNTEAYMRSGNLPARYETNTQPYYTVLTSTLASGTTTGGTIAVADASLWPSTGTVVLTQSGATAPAVEYITYTAKTNTALTIGARAQTGGNASAQTFTVSGVTAGSIGGTAPVQAELYSPQNASIISHWGSSVIMDGRFDNDKSFVFNAGMNTTLTNQGANTRYALMSLRLAPSVDSGQTGLLGVREILNRMQLALNSMDAYVSGSTFRVELILNGRPASGTFQPVGGSSLAQIAYHAANVAVVGGESIYSFFTNVGAATTQDLSMVRDIGASILSGGTSLTVPTSPAGVYPDGTDVLIIAATAFGGANSINARISWTEAQA